MENLVLLPSDDDSKIWYTIYQYMNSYIHIIYLHIIYIYISALYTIDVEIESARHPQVCPRNCFNTFPLTRPKDGPLPSGSQSCLENARGWFLVFDFHSKPGKWWPLPGYMEFHPPIYKHIYIYLEQWQSKPCIPGISHCHVWLQRVSQCGKCWPRLGISKVFSCRRIDHPDGAGSLWTLLLWIPWWVAKKNQDESNPTLWTCSCGACLYQPFLCW